MTALSLRVRVAGLLGALALLLGLAAPTATAAPLSLPAAPAAPAAPAWDWWGTAACAGTLIPVTATVAGPACAKKVIKGAKKKAGEAAEALANGALEKTAKAAAEWVSDLIKTGFTWWLTMGSIQVKDSGALGSGKSTLNLHSLMLGLGICISIILAMFQGLRMMVQRKGTPLLQVVKGLIINVLLSSAGVAIIDSLLLASDSFTNAILAVGFDDPGKAPGQMAAMLLPSIVNPFGLLAMALIVLLIGLCQLILLFIRQAAIPLQALLLPVAGSGQLGGETAQSWLPKLWTAILVIIAYKPCAAMIIVVGFNEVEHSPDLIGWIRGCVTLVLSVVSLGALMGIFAPFGGKIASATSGGFSQAMSSVGMLAMAGATGGAGGGAAAAGSAGSAGSAGGSTAIQHADYMDRHGPASTSRGNGVSSGSNEQSSSQQGTTAIQQQNSAASGNIPQQQQQNEKQAGAESAQAGAGSTEALKAASSSGTSTGKGAESGAVSFSLVAAEAVKDGTEQAGNTLGNGDQ